MIEGILKILISFCFGFCVYCIMNLQRNEKVFKIRERILRESIDKYFMLPSYDTMLYSFWKPLSKFEKELEVK